MEVADHVKRVDTTARTVVLAAKRPKSGINESIPFDRIVGIRGSGLYETE